MIPTLNLLSSSFSDLVLQGHRSRFTSKHVFYADFNPFFPILLHPERKCASQAFGRTCLRSVTRVNLEQMHKSMTLKKFIRAIDKGVSQEGSRFLHLYFFFVLLFFFSFLYFCASFFLLFLDVPLLL